MRKQQLSAEDLKLLQTYFAVRNENPCRKCSMDSATCWGCPEQSVWLKKFRAAEEPIKDSENKVVALFEIYFAQTAIINDLKKRLERVTQAQVKTREELAEYLDADAMKEVGFTAD